MNIKIYNILKKIIENKCIIINLKYKTLNYFKLKISITNHLLGNNNISSSSSSSNDFTHLKDLTLYNTKVTELTKSDLMQMKD